MYYFIHETGIKNNFILLTLQLYSVHRFTNFYLNYGTF